jgi:L-ascorbate metabolism protein UlaG (beta-lactamase superfamily)
MTITKLGHCCLLVEHKNIRIITDPGAWSTAQNKVTNVDIILITHEHPDHLHLESLEAVLKNNPNSKVVTNAAVGKIISDKSVDFNILENGQSITIRSVLLEAFGDKHEEIYEQFGMVQNTGYFVDNILFYPGDAFTNPGKSVEVLALPVVAPWMNFKTSMKYAIEIKPKIAFPVHDGMLISGRSGPIYTLSPKIIEESNIKFIPLKEGESFNY